MFIRFVCYYCSSFSCSQHRWKEIHACTILNSITTSMSVRLAIYFKFCAKRYYFSYAVGTKVWKVLSDQVCLWVTLLFTYSFEISTFSLELIVIVVWKKVKYHYAFLELIVRSSTQLTDYKASAKPLY